MIFRESVTEEYVYHPINVYHLLERAAVHLPKIIKFLPHLLHHFEKFDMAYMKKEFERACHGIADLNEYNNFKPADIAKGNLNDSLSGKFYQSNSPLNSRALFQIAEEARKANYFEGYVNWLRAAISAGKEENQIAGYMKTLRSVFQRAMLFLKQLKTYGKCTKIMQHLGMG